MSEAFLTGAILAVIGGYLDAYTYIARGQVFANAQTGNVMFLAMNIACGDIMKALFYVPPIIAFVLGILIAEQIKKRMDGGRLHWRQYVLLLLQVQSFRKIRGILCATTMCTGNLRSGTEALSTAIFAKDKESLHKAGKFYAIVLFFIIGAVISTFVTTAFSEKSVIFCGAGLVAVILLMFAEPPHAEST